MTSLILNWFFYFCTTLSFVICTNIQATPIDFIDMHAEGNCTCGGFSSEIVDAESVPVLTQTPSVSVPCDEDGADTCKTLCLAIATAAKAKGPGVICGRIVNADELKLSGFFKICEGPWTFTGMTADKPLCCEDSKAILCKSMASANNTQTT